MNDLTEPQAAPTALFADVRENQWRFWLGGVAAVLLGMLAVALPHLATLGASLTIGALFFASGVVEAISAFRTRKSRRVALGFLLGLLSIVAGLYLLLLPIEGIVALTLVLIAVFLAAGVLKLAYAWKLRHGRGWGWMLGAGLLSLTLGGLIWSGLPGSAFWVLGLFVGIDLLFYGTALLALVVAARRDASAVKA